MDRQIVYPGSIPLDTDILSIQRNAMVALGYLAQATLGTTTVVDGLFCSPTAPASLTVSLGPGSITSLGVVDASPPALLCWPLKDPNDLLDYQFDIAPALIGNDGDAIATLDITISPSATGDLALASTTADGSRAVLWLSGGQPGTTYTVTLSIGTQAGRTIARSVLLPVVTLAFTPSTPDILYAETGAPLVDENGNPILVAP